MFASVDTHNINSYSEPLYLAIRDLVVPDGETATISLQKQDVTSRNWVNDMDLVFDMGATDQVTFNATNVALNNAFSGTCTVAGATTVTLTSGTAEDWWAAGTRYLQTNVGTFPIASYTNATTIEITGDATGATSYSLSEAGDAIDVLLKIDVVNATCDIMWQNKRTGQAGPITDHVYITTRHFSDADQASYGNTETLTNPGKHRAVLIERSGSATVGSVEWGRQPVTVASSSWVVEKASSTVLATATHVASKLVDAMSPSRMMWLGGMPGGRTYWTTADKSFRERFGAADAAGNSNDPVPGVHNYRSITDSVLVIDGSPNDLTDLTSQGGRDYLWKMRLDLESILLLCNQQNISVVVCATLPSGRGLDTDRLIGTNSTYKRQWNGMVRSLCEEYGHTFLDFARSETTEASWDTPYEIATYEDTGNYGHLTDAGDTRIAEFVAAAMNTDAFNQSPYAVA
jgi:hypothetical protein